MFSRFIFTQIAYAFLTKTGSSWNPKRRSLQSASFLTKLPRGGTIGDTLPDGKDLVLLIDVDNTLYSDRELTSINKDNECMNPWQRGIESQIIHNTHLFGLKYFNLTSHQCDELYKAYGSTVEGVRHLIDKTDVETTLSRFYKEVYDAIDFSCLFTSSNDSHRSGYDHSNAAHKRRALSDFLKAICSKHTVYLASNSPKAHVIRVLNGMGLRGVNFVDTLTPDSIPDQTMPYPTKSSPFQFYGQIVKRHPLDRSSIVLLDDSLNNIRAAERLGIRGIHVGDGETARTLEEGLAEALGHILPYEPDDQSPIQGEKTYQFSDVQYLQSKNEVDFNSINSDVWIRLAHELALRIQQKQDYPLKIADLGSGVLSMLELVLVGGGEGDRAKQSLLTLMHKYMQVGQLHSDDPRTVTHLEYYAYETNLSLLQASKFRLQKLGFEEHATNDGITFRKLISLHPSVNIDVTVLLRPVDFKKDSEPPTELDLIIGCCFADLFDPDLLTQSLLRLVNTQDTQQPAPLVYFPITFTGTTQFSPAHPASATCPSDTSAFRMYSESLTRHRHNLEPSVLIDSIQNHGGSLLAKGQSKWIINPVINRYLWDTMLYFFGMSGGREILQNGLDSSGWIERSRLDKREIIVSNVDLLFRLKDEPNVSASYSDNLSRSQPRTKDVQEILFVAPYNVTTVTKQCDTSNANHLGPNEVEIESAYSLISSGTELKIFKGMFESAALDVNIKDMANEVMEYPLAYGYSLVGRVVACGADVDDADAIIGKLVFVFAPHASQVIVDRDSIQIVPEGIDAEDAIFMPSVETALSLVHDANVRAGENVAVFGQGLIGLLVTAILSMQTISKDFFSSEFCTVTSFDTIDDRLGVSSMMGANNALHPARAATAGPFDVSIEVSGNPRGLQSAIDNTSDAGRVIVGSWYGNGDVTLKLGIDFHRSHKTLQTSQVSTLPCALTGLWSKERRFALTWALLKAIRPSRLITKQLRLDDAQRAYELLDQGQEIAICFSY
jgi:threonine dehydrogenase-like Zn-dependent dehydrogenase/FMN phosphatase YigB (HAD superfamily)